MTPTSTVELYSTCRVVRVPVGSVKFEETEKCSLNNWKGMLNRGLAALEKWLKAENLKTLGKSTTSGKITGL